MPASSTDRARKAADTRAENAEKQRRTDEKLANDTTGGRSAKLKALANPVWEKKKEKKGTEKGKGSTRSSSRGNTARKASQAKEKHNKPSKENESEEEEIMVKKKEADQRKKRNKSHPPPAANVDEDSDEEEPPHKPRKGPGKSTKSQSTKPKKQTKAAPKPSGEKEIHRSKHRSDRSDTSNNSSDEDDEEDEEEEQSSSSSSDDEEDDSDESDEGALGDHFDDEKAVIDGEVQDDNGPVAVQDLFDIPDHDVEMATRPSSRSGTSPPGTDFEDFSSSHSVGINEHDDEDDDKMKAVTKSRKRSRSAASFPSQDEGEDFDLQVLSHKSYKARGKRHRLFKEEASLPIVNAVGESRDAQKFRNKKHNSAKLLAPVSWSDDACLVPEALSGRKRRLRDQSEVIQDIIRLAIDKATADVILRTAWPEEHSRDAYGQKVILDACRDSDFVKAHPSVKEVKQRIKSDRKFSKGISDLVIDRLSLLRSPAKAEAAKRVPHFQLGLGQGCKERVASLFDNLQFHMAGTWEGNEWRPAGKAAFMNPALIETMKAAYFSSPRSVGYRYADKFSSSLCTKDDEKELPASLIALNVTALYSSLYEFKDGEKKDCDFDGNIFLSTYLRIVKILHKLEEDKPIEFHNRMHEIYKLVVTEGSEEAAEAADADTAYTAIELL